MKFSLFFLVLLGTLALFNPGEDNFISFVQERASDVVSDRARSAGGGLFGRVAGSVAGEVAGAIAGGSVERHNYVLFSTYALDLNGTEREDGEWRFLGIGGQFFELEHPAMLDG